eukprot:CAMPEP_0198705576 /NCGR_PEP_ID=MMETSP1468-20131203/390499_1 /TAXON_ID=1461545 /ORGANISM="Mantoniella sp, Strain CCMP1436" /LENGTH=76 /DNA_ID=CAMNT_0044464445 /DNA_START=1500 /DNA_END=1730 /DNA_ORIENTATION=+
MSAAHAITVAVRVAPAPCVSPRAADVTICSMSSRHFPVVTSNSHMSLRILPPKIMNLVPAGSSAGAQGSRAKPDCR